MAKTKIKKLVRQHVLISEETLAALRVLAEKGNRSLSREIRKALEEHVAKNFKEAA